MVFSIYESVGCLHGLSVVVNRNHRRLAAEVSLGGILKKYTIQLYLTDKP